MLKPTYTLPVIAAAVLILGLSAPGLAYHDGGVAHCDGCHTMHYSENGETPDYTLGANLLKGADASSVCLSCHQGSGSYHIYSEDGSNQTPGGDFYWTAIDMAWTTRGNPDGREGYKNGHSVVAADFPEIQPEGELSSAPGGSFPASILGCQSCHDPHGVVPNKTGPIAGSGSFGDPDPTDGSVLGNYRLLGAIGYSPTNSGVTFVNPPPVARALSNRDANETDTNHAEYGSGTAEWCANCHAGFQIAGTGVGKHPTGTTVKLGNFVGNYNSYRSTGDTSGTFGDAYLPLVPIERGVTDRTALDPANTEGAVAGQSSVTCLSCHRAHASAFEYGIRWDSSTELLVDSHPTNGDAVSGHGTVTDGGALKLVSYYGRDIETDFNEHQRSLCNKCHLKD
jgi:hypothetical protein